MIHKKDKRETVEMVLLVIMYLSVFNCLSRSDFNMAFALACYYLWDLRFDQLNTLILILINISTLVFDLIWIMTVSAAWTYEYKNKKNSNWDGQTGIHGFVIFTSVITSIVKIGLVLLLATIRNEQKNNQQQEQPLELNQNYNSNFQDQQQKQLW